MSATPWIAELNLSFEQVGERTRLRRGKAEGPLYVQKPFYPEGGVCHLYLLHPPGGVAGGAELTFVADANIGTGVLITTPAATKFMRSAGKTATQSHSFSVADKAFLEWLPQETIVFDCAHARSETRVRLAPEATFVGCDVVSLGRPVNNELFETGFYTGVLSIERFCQQTQGYRPVYLDRQHYAGASDALVQGWGLGGSPVFGTLVATSADADVLGAIRQKTADSSVRATLVGEVLVVRCLGDSTEFVQQRLRKVWALLRPMLLNRAPHPPAIWRT